MEDLQGQTLSHIPHQETADQEKVSEIEALLNSPNPTVGEDIEEPGFWAERAKGNYWRLGQRSSSNPDSVIYKLRQMELLREPGLRVECNGWEFYQTVGQKLANIEALLIQSVGERHTRRTSCHNCRKGHGKFTNCTQAHSVLLACGNCHYGQLGKRCSFTRQQPQAASIAPIHSEQKVEIGSILDQKKELQEVVNELNAIREAIIRLRSRVSEIQIQMMSGQRENDSTSTV